MSQSNCQAIYSGSPLTAFFVGDELKEFRPRLCRVGDGIDIIFFEEDGFPSTVLCSHRPILSFRVIEAIRILGRINNDIMFYAKALAMGDVCEGVAGDIYQKIMAIPVPEEIIKAILEENNPLEIEELSLEVFRGNIPWRPEFQEYGIEDPAKLHET